jgi:hypothetical protein
MVRQTERADRAVKASQRRRAPNPGGAQRNLNLPLKPRKTNPVHLGRQDQPITRPIITASHIGTAQSKMSTNVSVIEGFFKNSIRSKNVSSIATKVEFFLMRLRGLTIYMDELIVCRFLIFSLLSSVSGFW